MIDTAVQAALENFIAQAQSLDWHKENLSALIKSVLKTHGLKMPKLAMPLRLLVTGESQTPSIDAVMALFGKHTTLERIQTGLSALAAPTNGA